MTAQTQVLVEMNEMRKIGITVPRRAVAYASSNPEKIEAARGCGMKISEIVDSIIVFGL